MGEIADLMLEGHLCLWCGCDFEEREIVYTIPSKSEPAHELIYNVNEPFGFPVVCGPCCEN